MSTTTKSAVEDPPLEDGYSSVGPPYPKHLVIPITIGTQVTGKSFCIFCNEEVNGIPAMKSLGKKDCHVRREGLPIRCRSFPKHDLTAIIVDGKLTNSGICVFCKEEIHGWDAMHSFCKEDCPTRKERGE